MKEIKSAFQMRRHSTVHEYRTHSLQYKFYNIHTGTLPLIKYSLLKTEIIINVLLFI